MKAFMSIKSQTSADIYNTTITNIIKVLLTMKRPLSVDEISRFTKISGNFLNMCIKTVVLYYAILYIILKYTMLCYDMLFYVMLYFVLFCSFLLFYI